ncbi:hypothetical protein TELCIR_19399, partial [Teladorsagia circumcincta]
MVTKTVKRFDSTQAHACCETDQPTDIATWDNISEDESESPKGMIRPESLTVTTIQEHEGEVTLHPTIIEPRPMRKRSEAVRRKEPRKQHKPATKLIDHPIYPWHDSEMFVPGNCRSVAKQMLRVTLHQERDKQSVSRAVVAEMIQAIKFKCPMHEANFITIAHLILQDAGEDIEMNIQDDQFNTAASEAVRPFLFEILDFIADLHVLAKLKKETNSDSVGGDLKVKLAEAIAVEMSRSNARDCRTVIRFIPWLMSPPSVTQAAPGAFADSVTNVRVLSWLLLGALHANHGCLPVPIECSQHMADYIHFVLAGFADQSKQSVVHMSALFHAFHLCQLWTVYCERAAVF